MVLTDDSTISTPPASPVSHYAQTTSGGATGYSTANSSGVSVVPHATLSHRGSAGSAASVSSYGSSVASSSKGLSSGVSVSTGLIGRTTRVSGTAFGGGGGVSSGSGNAVGGSGVSAGSGVSRGSGGFGGGIAIAVAAPAQGGAVSVVPVVGNRNYFATPQGGDEPGSLSIYDGDKPGVIIGESVYDVETNSNVDNTIVSSYGQPIGDALWPLLLMAMVYVLWLALSRSLCARR